MPNKAPLPIFQQTVQYFPTVSINLLIQNAAGEFLYVMRNNNPAKGVYWVPGGRILAGETLADAAARLLQEEVGIEADIAYISPVFQEEIFSTNDFDESDKGLYPDSIHHVHYLATAAYVPLSTEQEITLDHQSSDYCWKKEIPTDHPLLKGYFGLLKDHIR